MTDRERLLEQVREQEMAAASFEWIIRKYLALDASESGVVGYSRRAAHHALTAMALRGAIDLYDEVRYRAWLDEPV